MLFCKNDQYNNTEYTVTYKDAKGLDNKLAKCPPPKDLFILRNGEERIVLLHEVALNSHYSDYECMNLSYSFPCLNKLCLYVNEYFMVLYNASRNNYTEGH